MEKSTIERLETATDWLVRNGAFVLDMRGRNFLKSKLTEQGPVLLWITAQVDQRHNLNRPGFAGGFNS
ncbi:hypothetical protein [Tritonibacter sp. SIMBA_163]|uniref:Uncharacterized protein n=1 Tax=Tritonibacter scottomollicae TaxID=483013 RepID=A0ABZ0HPR0_TRISK|nr:hypothetical protein R1T40_22285 [Tritonibacter scottomollicae]